MMMSYKTLGDYIHPVNIRNKDLEVTTLLGVSIRKVLMPSIANTIGTNMKTYKIIAKNQFAYGPVTSRNGDKISIALLEEHEIAIVSQAYTVFEVIDDNEVLPEYLMMWFRRPEFDRFTRFKSHGSAREVFDWEELCDTQLPIPTIEKQRQIVAEYNTVTNRIKLNEQLNQKLEATAQALYKHWFVDFEFFCLPSDYRPHGQINPKLNEKELKAEINIVSTYKRVGGLPISNGKTWFIYLILCEDDSIYKGMTNDLYRRFYEHYTGQGAKHTQQHKPIKIIHWESFKTKGEAAKREKDLKTGYGRTWISRQIEKAGGLENIKAGLPAPKTQLRTAGKMVYNEELEKDIPVGWRVENVKEFSKDMKSGGTPSRTNLEYWNKKDVPWLKTGEIKNNIITKSIEFISKFGLKGSSAKLLPINTVLMSMYGVNAGEIGFLKFETTTNQACCGIICENFEDASYLYYHFLNNQEYNHSQAIGGAQQNLSKDYIENIKLLKPKNDLINKTSFAFFIKERERLTRESQTLQELQSLLLAKMTRNNG